VSRLRAAPPTVLTRPDRAQGEIDHVWPEALPGGRLKLFTIAAAGSGLDAAQIAVLDLQTGIKKVLVRGGSHAHYVASGHLVYAAAGTLRAVGFDLDSLEARGTPVPVVPDAMTTVVGGVNAVVAANGVLAYMPGGGNARSPQRTLVWVDRQGQEAPIGAPPRTYTYTRLSPDGTRVALCIADQEQDVWIWDLARSTLTRLTFDPGLDNHNAWTPDGRRVIFSSERGGARNLYGQAADGTDTVERLTESPNLQNITSVSPHGRWLAYEANNSGQFEVYVRPFPDVNSGTWQVSTGGGTRPLWARSGQELFYLSPDGRRFLMIKTAGAETGAAPPSIVVVQHWGEELKAKIPAP